MKKNIALLLLLFSTFGRCAVPVFSEENESAQNIPFSVSAQLPDNQLNKDVSYFDLQMKPAQEQTVHLEIENTSNEPIKLETSLYQGDTNSIGVIEYDHSVKGLKNDAQVNVEEIAKLSDKEIELSPKQTHDLQVKINMPDKKLSGIAVGAIRIIQNGKKSKNGNIQNNFAREIGLVLQSSDPEKIPSQLRFVDAKAEQVNARNVFAATIQNPNPKLIRLANVKATVVKEDDKKVVYQAKQQEASIAPNTVMNYSVPLEGKAFIPGTYVATFEADEGEHHWKLTKTFTVKDHTSKKLNGSDILIKSKPGFMEKYKWIVLAGCILFVVILSLSIYIGKIKRKLTEQENKENS